MAKKPSEKPDKKARMALPAPFGKMSAKERELYFETQKAHNALAQARQRYFVFKNLDDAALHGRHSRDELDAFCAAKCEWKTKVDVLEAAWLALVLVAQKRGKKNTKKS